MCKPKLNKYGKFIEVIGEQVQDYAFVGKACSNDDTRYFMTNTYCDDGKLISTDGKRIHWVDLGNNPWGFEQGKFYAFLKATTKLAWFAEIEIDGAFPNWKRVVPDGAHDELSSMNYKRDWSGRKYGELSKLLKWVPNEAGLNFTYLESFPLERSFVVNKFDGKHALKFTSGMITAVIMPIEIEASNE